MVFELDYIELAEPVGDWPAGATGTVVGTPAPGVLTVEIRNDLLPDGASLLDALLDVPESAVRVLERAPPIA